MQLARQAVNWVLLCSFETIGKIYFIDDLLAGALIAFQFNIAFTFRFLERT